MKIDIFNHIFPKIYFDKMIEVAPRHKDMGKRVREIPALVDLEARFRVMDQFDDYAQIICLAAPPLEVLAGPEITPELAKAANDGMAQYVAKYPERFPGFVASMPMNNPDAALEEIDRAIKDLKAVGVQFFSNVNGRPLDLPEFRPLFEKMTSFDLPIWIHPARGADFPDYLTEEKSKYEIWFVFGWPYETSVAMARLVFGGYFDQFPNLKNTSRCFLPTLPCSDRSQLQNAVLNFSALITSCSRPTALSILKKGRDISGRQSR